MALTELQRATKRRVAAPQQLPGAVRCSGGGVHPRLAALAAAAVHASRRRCCTLLTALRCWQTWCRRCSWSKFTSSYTSPMWDPGVAVVSAAAEARLPLRAPPFAGCSIATFEGKSFRHSIMPCRTCGCRRLRLHRPAAARQPVPQQEHAPPWRRSAQGSSGGCDQWRQAVTLQQQQQQHAFVQPTAVTGSTIAAGSNVGHR